MLLAGEAAEADVSIATVPSAQAISAGLAQRNTVPTPSVRARNAKDTGACSARTCTGKMHSSFQTNRRQIVPPDARCVAEEMIRPVGVKPSAGNQGRSRSPCSARREHCLLRPTPRCADEKATGLLAWHVLAQH